MHEILAHLLPGQRVLDLGSHTGSFDSTLGSFVTTRVDLDAPPFPAVNFAQADAARLPFPDCTFDAVISNHSLEHFEDLAHSLSEIGRILKPTGAMYIAVPDASTFCDRLYRWLARGGGHVNSFTSASDLAHTIQRATGFRHIQTRTLYTSLSYLNRKNFRSRSPRRLLLIGGGTEISLHLFAYFSRLSDRLLSTRLSVYGWALYLGNLAVPPDSATHANVCIRCGSGASSHWLCSQNLIRRPFLLPLYRCPTCGTTNLFFKDGAFQFSGL